MSNAPTVVIREVVTATEAGATEIEAEAGATEAEAGATETETETETEAEAEAGAGATTIVGAAVMIGAADGGDGGQSHAFLTSRRMVPARSR